MIALFIVCLAWCLATAAVAAEKVEITADVAYGHKDGLAMTFDVLRPKEHANGAGLLSIQSGAWISGSPPPEQSVEQNRSLLDKGFTVFIVRHGSGTKYLLPEIVDDMRRSVRFIRLNAARFGVDPQRLGALRRQRRRAPGTDAGHHRRRWRSQGQGRVAPHQRPPGGRGGVLPAHGYSPLVQDEYVEIVPGISLRPGVGGRLLAAAVRHEQDAANAAGPRRQGPGCTDRT